MADDYWDNVVLAMPMDGVDGSPVFADLKGHAITRYGDAKISTAQSKFGGSSGFFDGVGDYVSIAGGRDFNFGSENFTIEFWYYPISRAGYSTIIAGDEPDYPFGVYHGTSVNGGNPVVSIGPNSTSWFAGANGLSLGAVADSTWVHIAFVRDGDIFRLYKNGVKVAQGNTDTAGQSVGNISNITLCKNSTYYLSCYLDDLRITKEVARYDDDFTPPVDSYFDNIINTTKVLASLQQTWGDVAVIAAELSQSWSIRFDTDLSQRWSDAPVIKGMLNQPYGRAGVVRVQLDQRWINLIVVENFLNHHWACLGCASTILEQDYQLVEQTVSASLLFNYSLKDTNTITGVLKQSFWVTGNLSTKVLSTQYIVISDTTVFPISLDIKSSINQYAITASIELATYNDIQKFIPGTQVEVCGVLNENFILIVDTYDYDLSYDSDTFKVDLISPAALLDSPFAALINGDYTGMASEICKTLAGSISVTWNIIDWYIGDGVLSASEETPLSVIRKIVNAVGGVIQSLPDGSITVISRYPKSCNAWSVQPPIHSINYSEDVISEQFTLENAPGYNNFSIQDDGTSSTLLRVEVEEIDSNSKTIKVFVYPDVVPVISHSGNTGTVSLNYTGYVTDSVEEEVEFVSGESSVEGPINGINYSSWKYTELGAITYEPTGVLYSSIIGESLLDISYKTGYYSYTVSTSVLENIQIIIEADV